MNINSCERIRPERSRNAVQRLVWNPGTQFQIGAFGCGIDAEELDNPRMALRRLLKLYEGRQYREAASFLMRLPRYTLKATLPDIPVDLLIETLPHSLALLEALYSRLVELRCIQDKKLLKIEQLLWKIVHLLSTTDQEEFKPRKLLISLYKLSPGLKKVLTNRKKSLEKTVEGLGKHGLVSTNLPLPVAMKEELETRIDAYKLALHKIESFGIYKGDQGVKAASHQRQLSLKYSEIQQRLIDNQSLLNTLEKAGNPESLDILLSELKRRVEQDKEALRQWTTLRKSTVNVFNVKNPPLAGRLLQFSKGCEIALGLINEDVRLSNPDEDYDYEGEESSSSAGYHTDESCTNSEKNKLVNINDNKSRERLVERYADLYNRAHSRTLDALDALESLNDAHELKSKILYSVLVLSWRISALIQSTRRSEALKILNGKPTDHRTSPELEGSLKSQLSTPEATESGTREVAGRVLHQLQKTLYDFPNLTDCLELNNYARAGANLAWTCLARTNPLVLDASENVVFRSDVHVRRGNGSDSTGGTNIRRIVWPGLREGRQGAWLCRTVVLT